MDRKYVILKDNSPISQPMDKKEAIDKVKEYSKEGKSVYIVSEEEGKRIRENGVFNTPEWE